MNNIVERLRVCADDPMWADHAEVSKALLYAAADEIERLQGKLTEAHELLRRGLVLSRLGRLIEGRDHA